MDSRSYVLTPALFILLKHECDVSDRSETRAGYLLQQHWSCWGGFVCIPEGWERNLSCCPSILLEGPRQHTTLSRRCNLRPLYSLLFKQIHLEEHSVCSSHISQDGSVIFPPAPPFLQKIRQSGVRVFVCFCSVV